MRLELTAAVSAVGAGLPFVDRNSAVLVIYLDQSTPDLSAAEICLGELDTID